MIDAAFGTPLPAPPLRAAGSSRVEHAWAVLATVLDPEVPVVSVVDLGIVRDVIETATRSTVVVTPTYSGCPATEVIEASIVAALDDAGLGPVRVRMQRAPAWTTDWISAEGPAPAARLRHRAARPGRRRRAACRSASCRGAVAPLACPRCDEHGHRAPRRVRRDRLQGALALPRLRRAVRALQADLTARRWPACTSIRCA